MGEEEIAILVGSVFFSVAYWGSWYIRLIRMGGLGHPHYRRLPLYLALPAFVGVHLIVLMLFADKEVRTNGFYLLLFSAVLGVALLATNLLAEGIGINAIVLGVERNNAAVVWVMIAAWLATMLCSCGANIGEGPSIFTTIGPLLLAFGTLSGLWLLLAALTRGTASITVDRDLASGIRLAGLLVGWGLVLGRAVAGDWVSTADTLKDFVAQGWPALVLLGIGVAVEFWLKPSIRRGFRAWQTAGLFPGTLYVIAALSWLAFLGPV